MQEYEVKLYETISHTVTVNATDEDDAYNKAYEIICNGTEEDYYTEAEAFGDFVITKM